jgi:large subunit ribosomal protein L34
MASAAKALAARAGSSLLRRLLASPSMPLLRAGMPQLARLQAHAPPAPAPSVDAYEAEAVARLTSVPGEISFPCGLPSLRFFIDDATAGTASLSRASSWIRPWLSSSIGLGSGVVSQCTNGGKCYGTLPFVVYTIQIIASTHTRMISVVVRDVCNL